MNREILFKAKRQNWEELPKEEWWVEGFCLIIDGKSYIICDAETECVDGENTDFYATEWYEVDLKTICQYTGLEDKNGKKIFEGDIVKDDSVRLKGTVKFSEKYLQLVIDDIIDGEQDYSGFIKYVEVIGNIFDNPELLN